MTPKESFAIFPTLQPKLLPCLYAVVKSRTLINSPRFETRFVNSSILILYLLPEDDSMTFFGKYVDSASKS